MKKPLSFLFALLFVFSGCSSQEKALPDVPLKDAYSDSFLIGAAISTFNFSDRSPETRDLLLKHFNTISPDNELKPQSLHPRPDVWNFQRADAYCQFGKDNGMYVLGHTLCWHNQTPEFFYTRPDGKPMSKDEIFESVRSYIETVCTHFLGKVDGWDVINEIISEDGGYRDLAWVHALGADPAVVDEFVKHVYRCAEKYAPGTELNYNEFNCWRPSKLAGIVRLVKMLKDEGIRIDGVGIQAHWGLGYPKNEYIVDAIEQLAALGVKVNISELDVDVLPISKDAQVIGRSLKDPMYQQEEFEAFLDPYKDGLPEEVEDQLAARYEELFKIFYEHRDQIARVTFWGIHDGTSWKNGSPIANRTNYPLLFKRDYTPHKAYYSVINIPK